MGRKGWDRFMEKPITKTACRGSHLPRTVAVPTSGKSSDPPPSNNSCEAGAKRPVRTRTACRGFPSMDLVEILQREARFAWPKGVFKLSVGARGSWSTRSQSRHEMSLRVTETTREELPKCYLPFWDRKKHLVFGGSNDALRNH